MRQSSRRQQLSSGAVPPLVTRRVYPVLASSLSGRLWANMTISIEPEVHCVPQCCQRRTEQHGICIENLVLLDSGCWHMHTGRQTYSHGDTLIAILRTPTGAKYWCGPVSDCRGCPSLRRLNHIHEFFTGRRQFTSKMAVRPKSRRNKRSK